MMIKMVILHEGERDDKNGVAPLPEIPLDEITVQL